MYGRKLLLLNGRFFGAALLTQFNRFGEEVFDTVGDSGESSFVECVFMSSRSMHK